VGIGFGRLGQGPTTLSIPRAWPPAIMRLPARRSSPTGAPRTQPVHRIAGTIGGWTAIGSGGHIVGMPNSLREGIFRRTQQQSTPPQGG
jgi:hypothetical protein